ncbi:MAG: hypothetical protein ACK53K_07185 [Burkholderiales bacterium]|jgi:hypothetical protein
MSTTDLTASAVRPNLAQPRSKPQSFPIRHVPALQNAQSRAWHNLQAAWRLVPVSAAPATWISLVTLQQASAQKLLEQQHEWMNDWRDWWNTAQQLPRANTVSKLLEQEFDLALRMVQIYSNQAVNWANLQENFEVNYGHWANQQAKAARGE